MAVHQLNISWLTHCYRGQAPSHIWIWLNLGIQACPVSVVGTINITARAVAVRATLQNQCGRGLAPDGGVSAKYKLADTPLSGASPLPHLDPVNLGIQASPASVVGTINIPARKPFFTLGLGKMMRAPSSSITQRVLATSSASR